MSKILTLSIKQKYFDEILAGKKKQETREIRPNNAGRYIFYRCEGKDYTVDQIEQIPPELPVEIVPVKYDAIKLFTGAYSGKRPFIVVEVKNAEPFILTDENDEDIVYEYNGKEYLAAKIVYELGNIIEKSINV